MNWHIESYGQQEHRAFEIKRNIYSSVSKYQEICIAELYAKGVSLFLGGRARVFESDEFIFHEGFVHSVMLRHNTPENVLVIGDGDGGLVRELLKYPEMKKLDWVEIDEEVIAVCEQYLPSFPRGCRGDDRLSIIIEDGIQYLNNASRAYDVIFVSVTADGESDVASPFYRKATYRLLHEVLDKNGVIGLSLDEVKKTYYKSYVEKISVLAEVYENVAPFLLELPSFDTNWGFAVCSDSKIRELRKAPVIGLRYFSSSQSARNFDMPEYINNRNGTNLPD